MILWIGHGPQFTKLLSKGSFRVSLHLTKDNEAPLLSPNWAVFTIDNENTWRKRTEPKSQKINDTIILCNQHPHGIIWGYVGVKSIKEYIEKVVDNAAQTLANMVNISYNTDTMTNSITTTNANMIQNTSTRVSTNTDTKYE